MNFERERMAFGKQMLGHAVPHETDAYEPDALHFLSPVGPNR